MCCSLLSPTQSHPHPSITHLYIYNAYIYNIYNIYNAHRYSENSLRWVLTITNFRERVKEQTHGRAAAKLVNCYLDEAMGLHLATEMPVIAAKTLYERVSVDGVLEQRYFVSPKVNVIRAPYFSTDEEASRWERALESDRARPPKQVTLVGQISDATTFLKMRLSEKRACLRASGVRPYAHASYCMPLLNQYPIHQCKYEYKYNTPTI